MTADNEIRRLDEQTIAKIAAGEVVERPASVVKELIENSVDAGAQRIDVRIDRGGIENIVVRDDGHGMSESAARKAIKEHTTSKLDDATDLQAVETLGFRGEALHTIGAVSRMEITTKTATAATGTRLRYVGGDLETVGSAGCPTGTTVEVADLFFNTPARRKYLATPQTEFRRVSRIVGRYALANPDIALSFTHNDSEVFTTTGQGNRQAAMLAVFGREVAESMIDVAAEPTGPITTITGHVSDPETTRSSREYLATYVNGRYVESDLLRSAILDAYKGQLAADRYPFAVLFVTVPSEQVDVNVHPRKLAVRFADETAVSEAVTAAVREALHDAGFPRTSAPRGQSAPDETSISHETAGSDPTTATTLPTDEPTAEETATEPTDDPSSASPSSPPGSSDPDAAPNDSPQHSRGSLPDSSTSAREDSTPGQVPDSSPPTRPDITTQQSLTGDTAAAPELTTLSISSVYGQLADTYIVAESTDGLVLIDQHAADERIHYERLKDLVETETPVQSLAEPVSLSVTPTEVELFERIKPALTRLGFHAERDAQQLIVRSVPAAPGDMLAPESLHAVFDAILDPSRDPDATTTALLDELLADLACSPAVTANSTLTDGSIAALLSALDDCADPYACPHGRPTIIEIDIEELENRFERDYPGHDH